MSKTSSKNYWNKYYEIDDAPKDKSTFAKFIYFFLIKHIKKDSILLLDVGIGNGRDSKWFLSIDDRLKITGIDYSPNAILLNENYVGLKPMLCDFTVKKQLNTLCPSSGTFDVIYSRFSLHAINECGENKFLKWAYDNTNYICIEVRSTQDSLCGQGKKISSTEFITSHYRRFISGEKLKLKLTNVGFKIIYFKEEKDLAIHEDDNPVVIRLIAKHQF